MERRYDPELAAVVGQLPTFGLADPVEERRMIDELTAAVDLPPRPAGLLVSDRTVPGPPDVPVRAYVPVEVPAPRPAVLLVHGGGFTLGTLDMGDVEAVKLATALPAVVVAVDYRLAPEHPYPAGLEDCYAALRWVHADSSGLGVDPARVAVMGSSAGGGLSAALALLARDRGGPGLCFQLLDIPELDDRLETPSATSFVDTPVWNRSSCVRSWEHYLGPALTRGGADVPAYAAPSRATDLSGLPPAYVGTCEFDPLRDEALDYAQRLAQAGVPVELHMYPGTFHGSTGLAPGAAVSRRIVADGYAALRRVLHPVG